MSGKISRAQFHDKPHLERLTRLPIAMLIMDAMAFDCGGGSETKKKEGRKARKMRALALAKAAAAGEGGGGHHSG
jgi:hypothetical protein